MSPINPMENLTTLKDLLPDYFPQANFSPKINSATSYEGNFLHLPTSHMTLYLSSHRPSWSPLSLCLLKFSCDLNPRCPPRAYEFRIWFQLAGFWEMIGSWEHSWWIHNVISDLRGRARSSRVRTTPCLDSSSPPPFFLSLSAMRWGTWLCGRLPTVTLRSTTMQLSDHGWKTVNQSKMLLL